MRQRTKLKFRLMRQGQSWVALGPLIVQYSGTVWLYFQHLALLFSQLLALLESKATVLSTSPCWFLLNANTILSKWKKQIIPFFSTTHSSWRFSLKPNFLTSSVSSCYQSRGDRRRQFTALFCLSILPFSPYPGGTFINTVSSRFAYTNVWTTSSCNVLRSNLTTSASKTRKEVIARVVALVGKLGRFYWLPYTTNLALHFWSRPYLSVLYLITYWLSSTWWAFALAMLTDSQDFNCSLRCFMWNSISVRNRSSNGWPLSSR